MARRSSERPRLPRLDTASTFLVGAVAFESDDVQLSSADQKTIADIATVYHKSPGILRVVGVTPPLATPNMGSRRANVVAQALTRRGVPAERIMIGVDLDSSVIGAEGARVYLDLP